MSKHDHSGSLAVRKHWKITVLNHNDINERYKYSTVQYSTVQLI